MNQIVKKSSSSLSSLIDRIDWVMIETSRQNYGMGTDKIGIGFYPKSNKDKKTINQVRVRIGRDLIETLGWQDNDRIMVLHDPDDMLSFMFVRSDTGKGYRLHPENAAGRYFSLTFSWDRPFKLEARKSSEVQHHIHKNSIVVFRVGSQEEDSEE